MAFSSAKWYRVNSDSEKQDLYNRPGMFESSERMFFLLNKLPGSLTNSYSRLNRIRICSIFLNGFLDDKNVVPPIKGIGMPSIDSNTSHNFMSPQTPLTQQVFQGMWI